MARASGFFVETRSDGLPWTKEGCNLRVGGDFVPYGTRAEAGAAVAARRSDRSAFDDPAWGTAEYRVVPARKGRTRAKRPLSQADPDELWEPEARRLGLSVADLREQVRLADSIIEEIFAEEP